MSIKYYILFLSIFSSCVYAGWMRDIVSASVGGLVTAGAMIVYEEITAQENTKKNAKEKENAEEGNDASGEPIKTFPDEQDL
jgi:hypothetical protein